MRTLQRPGSTKTHPSSACVVQIFSNFSGVQNDSFKTYDLDFFNAEFRRELLIIYPMLLLLVKLLLKYFKHASGNSALSDIQSNLD